MPLLEDIGNGVKDKVNDITIYVARKYAENGGDVSEAAADVISDILPNPIKDLVTSSYNGMFNLMQQFMTSWMDYTPSINFQGDTMTWLTALTAPLTGFFAVMGLIVAGGRVMLFQRGEDIRVAMIGLGRVVGVSAAATSIATIFIPTSDLFADWVLEMAQPDFSLDGNYPTAETVVGVLGGSALAFSSINVILIFIQWCLMIVRAVALPIMVGFWTVSEAINLLKGDVKMTAVARWIIAFLLFKPVVAVIYGFAFKLMHGYDNFDGVFTGMAMIAVSIFALPALLRVLAPDAMAAGASGGGKELMALMGALTAAAAVVATGGGGAAASGGAAGAGAAGSGGAAGAAGGGSTGAGTGPTLADSGWGESMGVSPSSSSGGSRSEAPSPEKDLSTAQKKNPNDNAGKKTAESKDDTTGEHNPSYGSGSEAPAPSLDQTGYASEDSDTSGSSADVSNQSVEAGPTIDEAEVPVLPSPAVPDESVSERNSPSNSLSDNGTSLPENTVALPQSYNGSEPASFSTDQENWVPSSGQPLPHSLPHHRTAGPTSSYPRHSPSGSAGTPAGFTPGKFSELFRTAQYTIQSMPKLEDTFFDERGIRS